MATQNFFSIEEIEKARQHLKEMQDLNTTRRTSRQALEDMKPELSELLNQKGYKIDEIKSTLDSLGFSFSTRMINEVLSEEKKQKKPRSTNKKKSIINEDM
ncbi:hypothetical protein ACP179_01745 (plasmid) [Xenorhabdus stockiae]|uniref:hypothetical protein n=1 Tax=Xenorhabdus stockiae TaxID=351614 RepID=UPI003CF29AA1